MHPKPNLMGHWDKLDKGDKQQISGINVFHESGNIFGLQISTKENSFADNVYIMITSCASFSHSSTG